MQIEAKGDSGDFQEFLAGAKDKDEVWFRLVKVLISYEQTLPAELQHMGPRLEAVQMRRQWLEHAMVILHNREERLSKRPDYKAVRADLDAEMARLPGERRSR